MSSKEKREASRLRTVEQSLPRKDQHPRIAIFGSVDFWEADSPDLCDAIGAALGKSCPQACILTGANAVAQERISRAFLKEVGTTAQIFHLAPEGFVCHWGFGICLEAGRTSKERRQILAQSADICISIEGGPGTADEMGIAIRAGKVLIPMVGTGGASNGMFGAPVVARPSFVNEDTWTLLKNKDAGVEDSAMAVVSIVKAALEMDKAASEKQSKPRTTSQIEAMERTIVGALDITYTERPRLPEDAPAYVEPTLAGCAHRVFQGEEYASRNDVCLGDIYLGPKSAAMPSCWDELEMASIGGIVNCTNAFPCYFQGKIQYCRVAVNDECGADLGLFLDGATIFLHALINKGVSVLVHCEMGISRSSSVVIAYLIRFWKMTRDEAFLHVKSRRPRASPNPGFWDQLRRFEEQCRGSAAGGGDRVRSSQRAETIEFDTDWAKRSNALYATCHESPEILLNSDLYRSLMGAADQKTRQRLLTVCLDYLWGRGVLEIDLDWLRFVCETIDHKREQDRANNAASAVQGILRNEDSDFWNIWAGEVYEPQIQTVLKKLSLL